MPTKFQERCIDSKRDHGLGSEPTLVIMLCPCKDTLR